MWRNCRYQIIILSSNKTSLISSPSEVIIACQWLRKFFPISLGSSIKWPWSSSGAWILIFCLFLLTFWWKNFVFLPSSLILWSWAFKNFSCFKRRSSGKMQLTVWLELFPLSLLQNSSPTWLWTSILRSRSPNSSWCHLLRALLTIDNLSIKISIYRPTRTLLLKPNNF